MEMARTKLDNDRVTENEKKNAERSIHMNVFMKYHPREFQCVYEISFEYAIFAIMTAIANMIAAIEIN